MIVFTIRFIQGISWGYSEQLPHTELDTDTHKALIVNFNVVQKFKQAFYRNAEIGRQIYEIERIAGNSHSQELFLSVNSFQAIEDLITFNSVTNNTPSIFPVRKPLNDWTSKYQSNPDYQLFYRKVKDQLYNWLSKSHTWNDDETLYDVDLD